MPFSHCQISLQRERNQEQCIGEKEPSRVSKAKARAEDGMDEFACKWVRMAAMALHSQLESVNISESPSGFILVWGTHNLP